MYGIYVIGIIYVFYGVCTIEMYGIYVIGMNCVFYGRCMIPRYTEWLGCTRRNVLHLCYRYVWCLDQQKNTFFHNIFHFNHKFAILLMQINGNMEKFRNKYRISSVRIKYWDYTSSGAYSITLCTNKQDCFFGEIVDKTMILNAIGNIVAMEIEKTPTIRPDMNLQLGEFVVMPNHVHFIIIIGDNAFNNPIDNDPCNQFGPQRKNVASIVRGIKSAVTIAARKINPAFAWQPGFHEHIIRNNHQFQRITQYIRNNPAKWDR